MKQLIKIQQELKAPKGQLNKFGGYKYRNCEDILQAVKPLLGESVLTLEDELVLIGERYYIKATATLRSEDASISTTAYAREEEAKKGMDASQITGSASSYARKYALNGLFAIDDTKDADSSAPDDNTAEVKAVSEIIAGLSEFKQKEVMEWVSKKYGSLDKMPSGTLEQLKARLS